MNWMRMAGFKTSLPIGSPLLLAEPVDRMAVWFLYECTIPHRRIQSRSQYEYTNVERDGCSVYMRLNTVLIGAQATNLSGLM